jgi:hypothetical protein
MVFKFGLDYTAYNISDPPQSKWPRISFDEAQVWLHNISQLTDGYPIVPILVG